MNNQVDDVLVIGSGVAGLSFANELSIFRPDLFIEVLSKGPIDSGSTALAQGGMAVPVDELDVPSLFMDTVKSGRDCIDVNVVRQFINELPGSIERLESWGMSFDEVEGKYDRHWEGGHEIPRVLHNKDHTGKILHDTLLKACAEKQNISFREHQMVFKAQYEEGIWHLKSIDTNLDCIRTFRTYNLVFASGGIGALFSNTTNDACSTGDVLVIAHELGIPLADMQNVQFHPTALKLPHTTSRLPLITEAIRGKGARLVNSKGERFMFKYDPRGELATRDIVSKAIWHEMKQDDFKSAYLDLRNILDVKAHFPSVHAILSKNGYDMEKDLIPVVPAAHYLCGGIKTDLTGHAGLSGLFAIGECARTGLHGKNRLASNSLTEALVMALRAARDVACNYERPSEKYAFATEMTLVCASNSNFEHKLSALRQILSERLYQMFSMDLMFDGSDSAFGEVSLEFVNELMDDGYISRSLIELRNLILIGQMIENELKSNDKDHKLYA